MEKELNISEILKDKPQRTILYDYLHNIDVEFDNVEITEIETSIWCTRNKGGYNELFGYSKLGTLRGWLDGLQILLPSKEMRDWSKFSWKKGDVLVNKDESVHIIFEKFEDDAYKNFHGQYYLWEEGGSMVSFEEDENYMQTSDFNKANKEDAQEYIYKIEKILGGKLNMETLEIEKPQPEFKDGDIVVYGKSVAICRRIYKHTLSFYVTLNEMVGLLFADEVESSEEYRFATDEDKLQLFDALAKEGKVWDAEKKVILDLKPKVELKPFDKVLVKDFGSQAWQVSLFGYKDANNYYCCNGSCWNQCIPYAGNEHLLGITKDVEG